MIDMNIEVEIKAFISEEEYQKLLALFHVKGVFLGVDEQETFYFKGEKDLRIQRNSRACKIVLKGGIVHDEQREELEVECKREDFEKLEKFFLAMGYECEIKWFRKRQNFTFRDISVCIDATKGYGNILELEKMAGDDDKDTVLAYLKETLEEIGIPLTSREEFENRFAYYKEHWKELITPDEPLKI